ncbi:exodeoxyribonuclease III Xth [Mycobacterium tuberculosis]|nr:exodeoxyribonuclease III Xth [Mycobacterium tuberculosis]
MPSGRGLEKPPGYPRPADDSPPPDAGAAHPPRWRNSADAATAYGDGWRNGGAVLSRVGIEDVSKSIPGKPVSEGGAEAQLDEPVLLALQARAIGGATCGGVRVWSLYAPNGRTPDSAHYLYKLAWFAALRDALAAELSSGTPLMATGDYKPDDALLVRGCGA